ATSRFTTERRSSARWIGPSCATAAFNLRDMRKVSSDLDKRSADALGEREFGDEPVEWPRRLRLGAGQEVAAAALGGELAVIDDDPPAAQHRDRPADEAATFVGGVADGVVKHLAGHYHLAIGIPDGEIGVGADGDRALARVKPVELRVIGGGEGDEGIEIDA